MTTNEQTQQNKLIDTENRLVLTRGKEDGGSKWVKGVSFMVKDGN